MSEQPKEAPKDPPMKIVYCSHPFKRTCKMCGRRLCSDCHEDHFRTCVGNKPTEEAP